MKLRFYLLSTLATLILIFGSYLKFVPFTYTEILGFATGAVCVWLCVKEDVLNWPIGIANSFFFTILFFNSRLFADMGLQVVYIVLGVMGWYWWLKGGKNKSKLHVGKTGKSLWAILFFITVVSTFLMTKYLQSISDTAPFWDALTTVLSLVAQYLLTRKLLENWYIWITADIIYIWLYAYKNLYLTSILYIIFAIMCIQGYKQWKNTIKIKTAKAISK